MMTLEDAADALCGDVEKTHAVDVSSFFGAEMVIEWRRPSVPEYYRVGEDAARLKEKYPLWPFSLCLEVAQVAVFHVSPKTGGLGPALFYAEVVTKSPRLWNYLTVSHRELFPEYLNALDNDTLKNLLREGGVKSADGGDPVAPVPPVGSEADATP